MPHYLPTIQYDIESFICRRSSRVNRPAVRPLAVHYYVLMQSLGLVNNLLSVILVHTVLTLPFTVWYLVLYFRTIPVDIEESALVDGATLSIMLDVLKDYVNNLETYCYICLGDVEVVNEASARRAIQELDTLFVLAEIYSRKY